jgi:uncharacterized protein (TIGR03435 family)
MRKTVLYLSMATAFTVAQPQPKFDAASVKPFSGGLGAWPIGGPGGLGGRSDPALVRYAGFTLKYMVTLAYAVQPYQVSCPAWMESERYDVTAKVPAGATKDQVRLMLRNLIAERFHLVVRHETKEMSIYVLTTGKNGSKLKESAEDPGTMNPTPTHSPPNYSLGKDGFPQLPRVRGMNLEVAGPGRVRINAVFQPLSEFARFLGLQLCRPVADETGLHGYFDFHVDFTPAEDQVPKGPGAKTCHCGARRRARKGPDLIAAIQQQLGLKLESRKGPVEILFLDHADKAPTEN